MADEILSKGKFAERIGVSAGRVSQMIADGTIEPGALAGEGRMAKIRVALAVEQIRRKRDIGQALGNGLETRLDDAGVTSMPADAGSDDVEAFDRPIRAGGVEDQIKVERLARERRLNRQAEEQDAIRRGEIMEASDARVAMNRIARMMMERFEGALPDFATALSAKFELPQRDVLHELRQVFAQTREKAEVIDRQRAAEQPEYREMALRVSEDA